ncbi:MAG: hypothetical protein JW982_07620, partial [Spirochaetes bacterium]|nr:hypothetical protein [Spirochaetota bacterium]
MHYAIKKLYKDYPNPVISVNFKNIIFFSNLSCSLLNTEFFTVQSDRLKNKNIYSVLRFNEED